MNPLMKGPSLQLTACFVVERTRGVSKLDLRSNLTQPGLMDYLLEVLIQLVAIVWRADSEIRDRSLLGSPEWKSGPPNNRAVLRWPDRPAGDCLAGLVVVDLMT